MPLKLVWDGDPYHRAQTVQVAATALDITLEPLPVYSPDFMPVEHLWQWLREDVTYHASHTSQAALQQRVARFQQEINAQPLALADRLWGKGSVAATRCHAIAVIIDLQGFQQKKLEN